MRRKSFTKSFLCLDAKIAKKAIDALAIFEKDPFDLRLRNHALRGEWKGYRSLDVTGDFRIIFIERSDGSYELVELVDIGTHSQLYG